ncbi:MAG: type II toxin-antitoxin system VapC family toxin [Thermoanaerobaculia bacterium]|nr:type II toxin-antitoxin system VapC family toxin [Thermoanaerobaculia bacterium]
MRLLLDTHVFLWYVTGSRELPARLQEAIRDPENDVLLSVASVWEASIKHRLGKLALPSTPGLYLPLQRKRHGIGNLPVDEAAVARLDALPLLHRDPFDRMLISQALAHELTLATVDDAIKAYPVACWG